MADPESEKLQKVMARRGLGSRREIETWIQEGRIKVNGKPATLGDRVTREDQILLDGHKIPDEITDEVQVLIYNKPEGQVTTRNDPEGRPTVYDRLPKPSQGRWIAIGRLDINTTGLLLFTTDGELANRLMHPSSNIDREYVTRVLGEVDDAMLTRLKEGVLLEDGVGKFSDISEASGTGANKWYHVVIQEGRNREVRRLWESQGVQVNRLKRVRFGFIFLPSRLALGRWELMRQKDVDVLYDMANLPRKKVLDLTPGKQSQIKRQMNKKGRGKSAPESNLNPADKNRRKRPNKREEIWSSGRPQDSTPSRGRSRSGKSQMDGSSQPGREKRRPATNGGGTGTSRRSKR